VGWHAALLKCCMSLIDVRVKDWDPFTESEAERYFLYLGGSALQPSEIPE